MQVTAVIPCHNESKHIAEIVKKTKKHVNRVIVVDNMSMNGTFNDASDAGAYVYRQLIRGAGASTRMGINYALNPVSGLYADAIVTLDGDGQHDPDEIPVLLQPIIDNEAELVIGSRFLGEFEIPKYRKFGINVITRIYNGIIFPNDYGHYITDSQSCFRAFTRNIAEKVKITEDGFGFSTEFLVKARAKCLRIREVPISCIYHEDYSENSTLNPIRHGLEVAWKTLLWRVKEEF